MKNQALKYHEKPTCVYFIFKIQMTIQDHCLNTAFPITYCKMMYSSNIPNAFSVFAAINLS